MLDRSAVDRWYKINDKESFAYARELIAKEGLLVGGSSGSAIAAMVQAAQDLNLGEDKTVVVILPDSIRNYLSKFVDDDWLAANDLLPRDIREAPSHGLPAVCRPDVFGTATVQALQLKQVQSIFTQTHCHDAVEIMRGRGFDQLPVLGGPGGRLVGLVTLGNLLSRIGHGRSSLNDPVSEVMFDFSRIHEVTTDPRDLPRFMTVKPNENGPKTSSKSMKRKYVEITMSTPLRLLQEFFDWNSAAVVTEKDEKGIMRPQAVATKIDLLSWLEHQETDTKR